MKHNRIGTRIGALALCAALTTGALAATAGAQGITAQLSPNLSIVVDGTYRTFYNAAGGEVHPIVYNGTTYLPVRAIGELMGKNVNWDQASLTVSLGGARTAPAVTGTPDTDAVSQKVAAEIRPDIKLLVDGVSHVCTDAKGNTVYPLLYQGSVYLPLRDIGNLMQKDVSWDGASSTVRLSGGTLVTDADSFNSGGSTTTQTPNGLISAETAKSKALAHAGLTAGQVHFVQAKLEWEDGRQVYDVEFYTDGYQEYDYEIDAATGEIRSYDYDAEHYAPGGNTGALIGEAEAKRIALAQVSGAGEADIRRLKLDYDDGRAEYEVKIIYGAMEYEFEIDAATGAVLSRDMESIYD